MKRMMIAVTAASAIWLNAFADDAPEGAEVAGKESGGAKVAFWGFGNYGMYSGYQLYGSLVNSEPTLQGYLEGNMQFLYDDMDFGYLGVGLWSNTDLTDKRRNSYGKAFNEWDPNIHWGKTFWFDDDKTWGLDYRTEVVWYYYPHRRHNTMWGSTATTMDWNHAFELKNPYVTPYFKWVHEYHENKANLFLGGFKKSVSVCKGLTVTPQAEWVYRSSRYNWCFPTAGFTEFHGGGMASFRLGAEATYMFTDWFGLFAKAYWCHTWDHSLRAAAEHGSGADYGQYKDFAWGGVGVAFNF